MFLSKILYTSFFQKSQHSAIFPKETRDISRIIQHYCLGHTCSIKKKTSLADKLQARLRAPSTFSHYTFKNLRHKIQGKKIELEH